MVPTAVGIEGRSQLVGTRIGMVVLRAELADGPRATTLIGDMTKALTSETPPRRRDDRAQWVGIAHDS